MLRMVLSLVGFVTIATVLLPATAQEGEGDKPPRKNAAVERLKVEATRPLEVFWPEMRSTPARVTGLRWSGKGATPEKTAMEFLTEYPELLPVSAAELALVDVTPTKLRRIVRFQQRWNGLDVLDAQVTVVLDATGRVLSFASAAEDLSGFSAGADIGAEAAVEAAWKEVHGRAPEAGSKTMGAAAQLATKVVLAAPGTRAVVYRVVVPTIPLLEKTVCLVDASTGKVLRRTNEVIK